VPLTVDTGICQARSRAPPENTCYCLASLVAVCQEINGSMIDKREILEAASSFSLLPNTVEKDYVLGWVLAGINAHDSVSE
jgi:hypothetical protein